MPAARRYASAVIAVAACLLSWGVEIDAATSTATSPSVWSVEPSGVFGELEGISCSSPAFCVAVGLNYSPVIAVSTDEGTTWVSHDSGLSSSSLIIGLQDVSCPSPSLCVAVGGYANGSQSVVLRSTDGGVTWSRPSVQTQTMLLGVSCPTTSFCMATGYDYFATVILRSMDGGLSWTDVTPQSASISPHDGLRDVSCPTASDCVVVGATSTGEAQMYITHDGGASWRGLIIVRPNFFSVACPTQAVCYAVGGGFLFSTKNGGTTWSLSVVTGGQIACLDANQCVMPAGQGQILRTTDGGASWTSESSGGTTPLIDATCASPACWMVGYEGVIVFNTPLSGPPGVARAVHAVAGDTEATVTWTPPIRDPRAPISSYTVTATPGGASVSVDGTFPVATITGLSNGIQYTFSVTASNRLGSSASSAPSNAVIPTAVARGPAVSVLPAMSNRAYGGYLTIAYLENLGAGPAHIRVQYSDQFGNAAGLGNSVAGLPAAATWTLRTDNADSLAALAAGSALVYSDQPLAVFVNEFAPGNHSDATSYTGISVPGGIARTIYAPAIANNAYGGYTTGIGLVNLAAAAVDVTVDYRDTSGGIFKTQHLPGVAAGAYQGLYSADGSLGLPSGFAGTATISSSGGNLAAVVNETGPGNKFSSYDGVSVGSTTLLAPVALRNAYGGYNTGIGIQNTTAGAGTVTITYYDYYYGTPTVKTFPIAANGYVGVYQGTDIPTDGAYTARITSTVAIAAAVNEVAQTPDPTVQQSTAYNTFVAGSASLHLPLVESSGSDGWSTGEGIMNAGTVPTTVTVTYYDTVSGAQVASTSKWLPINTYWGAYQPQQWLGNGVRATAVVTAGSGGEVALICNESNATSFMSYGAQ